MGAIELIKSDLFRYAGTTSSKAFIKTYVKEAGFRFSVAFRLVNAGGVLKLFGIILWKLRNHQQIQILRKTKIGYGLYIGHGGPVIINPTAVIGNNYGCGVTDKYNFSEYMDYLKGYGAKPGKTRYDI